MSLFDKDFKLTFEAAEEPEDKDLKASEEKCENCDEPDTKKDKKAPAKKKDDKVGDSEGEEGEEAPAEEPNEDEMKEAASLVDSDFECDSLMEMRGPVAIHDCEEEVHYLCLEAVAMQIAMDKTDQKLTEAYVVTESEEAKEEVKKSFKESVARYWERLKGFMERVRLAIMRTARRVTAYIQTAVARVMAKFAASGKHSEKLTDATVKAPANVKNSLKDLINSLNNYMVDNQKDLYEVAVAAKASDKDKVSNVTIAEKSDILKHVLGEEADIKAADFGSVANIVSALKNAKKDSIDLINAERANIDNCLKRLSSYVKSNKDLDTEAMTVGIAAINKLIVSYNRKLSVLTSVLVAWLGARVRVLRANDKKATESFDGASLFEQFMAMTE